METTRQVILTLLLTLPVSSCVSQLPTTDESFLTEWFTLAAVDVGDTVGVTGFWSDQPTDVLESVVGSMTRPTICEHEGLIRDGRGSWIFDLPIGWLI